MTLNYPETGDTSADRTFDEANALFHRAVGALGDLVKRLEAGEFDASAEAETTVKKIDKQLELVMRERQRVEERKRKEIGAAAGGVAINFDAARDEIGRRLARLRAANGAGVVSEGPDG
ncbi:MAG: hypothetical protein NXH97_07020 [Rhodobacteraceae bacterium]|nr:hypothetical protein [Paracoccaceae bacterium]